MRCGEQIIDGLLAGDGSAQALGRGAEGAAVGHVQDLLRGHGFPALPDPRVGYYLSFGHTLSTAVMSYRKRNGLEPGERVDAELMADLVRRIAPEAVFSAAYLPLVLDVPFDSTSRLVWLSSLFETRGVFSTTNNNTDRCGVSFGILQWSQKAGQLHTLLKAGFDQEPEAWARIFGDTAILEHTSQASGGVDPQGWSTDARSELTKDPWTAKLQAFGADHAMQRVQCRLAASAYEAQLKRVRSWGGPVQSERGYAFLLDLCNQFGPGRVMQNYQANPGATEAEVLAKLEDIFTNLASAAFRPQVRERREFFRTTKLLSDAPLSI